MILKQESSTDKKNSESIITTVIGNEKCVIMMQLHFLFSHCPYGLLSNLRLNALSTVDVSVLWYENVNSKIRENIFLKDQINQQMQ